MKCLRHPRQDIVIVRQHDATRCHPRVEVFEAGFRTIIQIDIKMSKSISLLLLNLRKAAMVLTLAMNVAYQGHDFSRLASRKCRELQTRPQPQTEPFHPTTAQSLNSSVLQPHGSFRFSNRGTAHNRKGRWQEERSRKRSFQASADKTGTQRLLAEPFARYRSLQSSVCR